MKSPSQGSARARRAALAAVELVVLDVDGTLTDGSVRYLDGRELVSFHVHDGAGLVWLRRAGIQIAWISGRGSPAVRARAKELGVREVHLRVDDKQRALEALQRRLGIAPARTLAMGDDLADLALARRAGLFAAPANARREVKLRADLVLRAAGGSGAVRELCELVLTARGEWSKIAGRSTRAR